MMWLSPGALGCVAGNRPSCGFFLRAGFVTSLGVSACRRSPDLPRSVEKISCNSERYSPNWDSDTSSDGSCTGVVR